MSGSTMQLWRELSEAEAPLSVVLYSSEPALEEVIETVRLLAPEHWKLARTSRVEDAFTRLREPLLLTADNEGAAVRMLDGRRAALLEREMPTILFLRKGGSGEEALRRAPGLASWLQGRVYDPEPAEIDVERESDRFTEITGLSPRAWLEAFRRGEVEDTLENSFLYQRALLLGDP